MCIRDSGSVGSLRGVVELAQGGVPGAGVVPGVGALQPSRVQTLEDHHLPVGLEVVEQGGERGAHDAGAHEDDIGGFGGLR